jgi:hypothetical protein
MKSWIWASRHAASMSASDAVSTESAMFSRIVPSYSVGSCATRLSWARYDEGERVVMS